jgi:hypothetical protein
MAYTDTHLQGQTRTKHIIRHHNVIHAIESLWGDPAHAKHIVYAPQRVFSDANRDNQIFPEMWMGHWWTAVQVCQVYSCIMEIKLKVVIPRAFFPGAALWLLSSSLPTRPTLHNSLEISKLIQFIYPSETFQE